MGRRKQPTAATFLVESADKAPKSGSFGFKMLQQMGWSEGEGLGRTRTGATDYVRVKQKRDNSGIGGASLAQRHSGASIAPTTDLDGLLARLSRESSPSAIVGRRSHGVSGHSAHAKRARAKAQSTADRSGLAEVLGTGPAVERTAEAAAEDSKDGEVDAADAMRLRQDAAARKERKRKRTARRAEREAKRAAEKK